MRMRGVKHMLWMIAAAVLLVFLGWNIRVNRNFCITNYEVKSEKLTNDFRAVLITDLHDTQYGEHNSELIEAIRQQEPDVILIAGDFVSKTQMERDFTEALDTLKRLSEEAPVYYGYGNHEYALERKGMFHCVYEIREMENVHLIRYGRESANINGNDICIGAMSVSIDGYQRHGKAYFPLYEDPSRFFILMSHYPWIISDCNPNTSIDVVVSGHAHGGQVHLYDDVGLFAPGKGFFAPYTSGIHDINGTTQIVSRGLGDHTIVPRINNQPELVVIDFRAEHKN